ncbi:SURF1 family protein [Agromyces sp. MMS24-K17]|uniref:SURF1 family cytochrome oxidase biogenesis protein n=1 Tax=Agromyces sp. MMS24-K17 TaxID=3372850 RepID=UPI0037550580
MNEWGFLRSKRWAGYLALVVVFAIACCALGTWQLNRRAEAQAEIARIDRNYDADPVPVTEALPDSAGFDIDQRWRVVALSGEYLADEEVVVRNRPYQGASGFEVVTPFRLDDGTVFFVDRGWISQGSDGRPSEYAAPPAGPVDAVVRLKAGEGTIAGRTAAGAELATIDLDELADRVGEPSYTGAYGLLVQQGDEASEPPLAFSRPVRDEGPHLSYALQWFVFALMAFVGLGWAANQERKALLAASGTAGGTGRDRDDRGARSGTPTARPSRASRTSRGGRDADVEDEILDRG